MKLFTFPYFNKFSCKASRCTDSCCKGWEVRIDPSTEAKYRTLCGALGDKIRSVMCDGEEGAVFEMSGGRCPFLNDSGLCDIITEYGEDMISDICKRHPRYFTALSDVAYGGLGMSCEEAARLILTEDGREYVESDANINDGEEYDPELYDAVISARNKCIDIIYQSADIYSALSGVLSEILRIDSVIYGCETAENTTRDRGYTEFKDCIEEFVDFLSGLEYMSGELLERLWSLLESPDLSARSLDTSERIYLMRILSYLVDRYLTPVILDGDCTGASAVIAVSLAVVSLLFLSERENDLDSAVHLSKLFSSEIEYSTDNLDIIRDADEKVIDLVCQIAKDIVKRSL